MTAALSQPSEGKLHKCRTLSMTEGAPEGLHDFQTEDGAGVGKQRQHSFTMCPHRTGRPSVPRLCLPHAQHMWYFKKSYTERDLYSWIKTYDSYEKWTLNIPLDPLVKGETPKKNKAQSQWYQGREMEREQVRTLKRTQRETNSAAVTSSVVLTRSRRGRVCTQDRNWKSWVWLPS